MVTPKERRRGFNIVMPAKAPEHTRIVSSQIANLLMCAPSPLAGEGWGEGASSQKALFDAANKQELFTKKPLTRRASRVDLSRKGRGDVCRQTVCPNPVRIQASSIVLAARFCVRGLSSLSPFTT
jgi:hypothetical protein